jgi:O-antigen/teichoic acid export membrane protein
VEKAESLDISYSTRSIAKNTLYNLLGYTIPLIFALIIIPLLIKKLGVEKFGVLNIAWMIIGYFSFFDFGIGKGLTKIISERLGSSQTEQIPIVFWTSLFLMFSISLLITIGISFFVPSLVNVFRISPSIHQEITNTFYILAFSIPIVSTTAGLRGVLEAHQKFGVINIIRVILGIFTFLGPLLVLLLTNSLFWIVTFLIVLRFIIWILYFFQCFRVNKAIRNEIKVNFKAIMPVLRFSMWITLANVVGPIIIYSDRFLIGALISASAITYYATPYEIVTKLLLLPGALSGVLFPVFSASFLSNPELSKKIFLRGAKFIFIIIYPMIFLIAMFAFEGMKLWLGAKFAVQSYFVLQLLSIGILMNSISLIPNNFFQGIGKPKIPTLLNTIELPFYIFLMWFLIQKNGINGAAFAYMLGATADAAMMYIFANKIFGIKFKTVKSTMSFTLLMVGLIFPFLLNGIILKLAFSSIFLLIFIMTVWRYYLSVEEKHFIFSLFKLKST